AEEANRPGAGTRFMQGMGLPSSMDEARQIVTSEEALPWWKRIVPHEPGSSPSGTETAVGALGGSNALQLARMIADYGKQRYGAGKDVYTQSEDTGRQLSEGKMGFGEGVKQEAATIRRGVTQTIPFVGPTLNTAESDIQSGNAPAAFGGLS